MTKPNFLVAIAKNEDLYIAEWVHYHIKLGFDQIVLYTDNWDCKFQHDKLTVIPVDHTQVNRQVIAYNDFLKDYQGQYEWVAFFDVDEFLDLIVHDNVNDFLAEYQGLPAILINWAVFGNNHHIKLDINNTSVLKRFTKRSDETFGINHHVKTIRHHSCTVKQEVHSPTKTKENNLFNTDKEPYSKKILWDIAKINHYFTKSEEEWGRKVNRGNATHIEKRRMDEYPWYARQNKIIDTRARDFLYRKHN